MAIFPGATLCKLSYHARESDMPAVAEGGNGCCLSWRLVLEANNMHLWHTIPPLCQWHVEAYMTVGQYDWDISLIVDWVTAYADEIAVSGDGMDAWILDVDDTCISNIFYYKGKRRDPYDPASFEARVLRGECPATPAVQGLFRKPVGDGFKVILLTGREQETLGTATISNLLNQGFIGCERPIMRTLYAVAEGDDGRCLRLAVEANNMSPWHTVPPPCQWRFEAYMTGGQYDRDLSLIVDQATAYADGIAVSDDGMDAWILDVDDTCISNVFYYRGQGHDPYDPAAFEAWALRGECPAIPAVLGLFRKLVGDGFKVILLTGREQEVLETATVSNLHNEGFIGYERLIMRTMAYEGLSAKAYKSEIRRQLVEEGYRILGNVGDQRSDLEGEFAGDRTFKIPNPMYFIP